MKLQRAKRTAERRAHVLFLVELVRATTNTDEPVTRKHPIVGVCVAFGRYYYLVTWKFDYNRVKEASNGTS